MEGDWSNIPSDVGYVILCKMPEFVDKVRFGAVCKNWYQIFKESNLLTRPSCGTLPMLFVPVVSECKTQRMLYSVPNHKFYQNVTLSDIPNKRCCGSSYGWLAFMERNLSVTLINPFKFKGFTIHLPILEIKENECMLHYVSAISKLIVLPESTPDNYSVVAIYGGMRQLATIRSGENDWTYITGNEQILPKVATLCDMVLHKGLVYTFCGHLQVFSVNINTRPPRVETLRKRDPISVVILEQYIQSYIVESTSGDLYIIRRRSESHNDYLTKLFKVLKLEFDEENGKVIRVVETKTLDGDSVFMNDVVSLVVKASNFGWCEPNSIYFTEDFPGPACRPDTKEEDSGIYNVKEQSITRMYVRHPDHRFRPSAIWVQPPFK